MAPWFLWTILAVICWGLWAIVSKMVGESLTPAQSQALSTTGILPILFLLAMRRGVRPGRHHKFGIGAALGAGVLTCLGNVVYYTLLKNGKAVTVVPLTAIYPVVTVMLALVFLHERLSATQWLGIGLSLVAILLFNVQSTAAFSIGAVLMVLAPIFLWGVAAFMQKVATDDIDGESAAAWFLSAFVPVGFGLVWFEPLGALPTLRGWLLTFGLGFTFAFGNMALLFAFARDGKASVITPLAGLYPIVSIPLAIFLFGERIGSREAIAILCALAGIAAVSWPSPQPQTARITA